MYKRKLQQDPLFINHCFTEPQEVQALHVFKTFKPLRECLISTSAAFSDPEIGNDHLLDGYSYGLIIHITPGKDTELRMYCKKIEEDEKMRIKEKSCVCGSWLGKYKNVWWDAAKETYFGLFTGKLPFWKTLFAFGRLPQILWSGRAVERTTAHQPIFYPPKSQLYFCSSHTYPAFDIMKKEDDASLLKIERAPSFAQEDFESGHYTCMHPLYDYEKREMITYTFLHSRLCTKTTIKFYSFFDDPENDEEPVIYEIDDTLALHMFGFTKNYYVIFANSLTLENFGYVKMIFGKPILRTLDDNYCGDISIHFVSRDGDSSKSFSVDAKQKGFVYHTINCFETGEENKYLVVDALVSKLNESRESSQFELDMDRDVYDNEGSPYRFVVDLKSKNVQSKLLVSQIGTSIDFHCINPLLSGKEYKFWWMVSHTRERDMSGKFERNISKLHQIRVENTNSNDPFRYNPEKTLINVLSSTNWNPKGSVYLRTPIFVPFADADTENDGLLFCWSYESDDYERNSKKNSLNAKLLVFTSGLILLHTMDINAHIPYSIHSFAHILEEGDISTTSVTEN